MDYFEEEQRERVNLRDSNPLKEIETAYFILVNLLSKLYKFSK